MRREAAWGPTPSDQIRQFLAGFEIRDPFRRNFDARACFWIAGNSGLAPPGTEAAEPADLDPVTRSQRTHDAVEHGHQKGFGSLPRDVQRGRPLQSDRPWSSCVSSFFQARVARQPDLYAGAPGRLLRDPVSRAVRRVIYGKGRAQWPDLVARRLMGPPDPSGATGCTAARAGPTGLTTRISARR